MTHVGNIATTFLIYNFGNISCFNLHLIDTCLIGLYCFDPKYTSIKPILSRHIQHHNVAPYTLHIETAELRSNYSLSILDLERPNVLIPRNNIISQTKLE